MLPVGVPVSSALALAKSNISDDEGTEEEEEYEKCQYEEELGY